MPEEFEMPVGAILLGEQCESLVERLDDLLVACGDILAVGDALAEGGQFPFGGIPVMPDEQT